MERRSRGCIFWVRVERRIRGKAAWKEESWCGGKVNISAENVKGVEWRVGGEQKN